jgi:hypothetical protein
VSPLPLNKQPTPPLLRPIPVHWTVTNIKVNIIRVDVLSNTGEFGVDKYVGDGTTQGFAKPRGGVLGGRRELSGRAVSSGLSYAR